MRITYTKTVEIYEDGCWATYYWSSQEQLWKYRKGSEGFVYNHPLLKTSMRDSDLTMLSLATQ